MKGRPFASRLVASCSSSMSYVVEILRSSSAICGASVKLQFRDIRMETCDRKLDIGRSIFRSKLVDVLDPVLMIFQVVCRQPDHFHISLFEFALKTRDFGEFGSADGGKISWMREQNCLACALIDFAPIREGQQQRTHESPIHS